VDAEGKIICQCHTLMPYTPIKDCEVAMDKVRRRLAEYLVPLVQDKFVPKFEYETTKMMQEIAEMNKQLANAMSGHLGAPEQLAEQKTTLKEMETDGKPDEAVNSDVDIPEEPSFPESSHDYSPEALKAKIEMEKKFSAKIGPRINFSIPWEGE